MQMVAISLFSSNKFILTESLTSMSRETNIFSAIRKGLNRYRYQRIKKEAFM